MPEQPYQCRWGRAILRRRLPPKMVQVCSKHPDFDLLRGGSAYTLDDLDSLMSDIQSQSTRRRLPGTYEMPKMAARKTTARKSATVSILCEVTHW
jgi:hypothetical protein